MREGGSGLSAGERQLISIGRALLADPRILILDEATSNIDRPTEVLIEKALDRLLHGRTSIVIAHRLATVRRADEIVVLDRGRIVERGSEAKLMAAHGQFAALAARARGAGARGRRLMSAVASGYVGILRLVPGANHIGRFAVSATSVSGFISSPHLRCHAAPIPV